jgi:hypothetical protein
LGGFDEALDTGAAVPGGSDLDIFYRIIRAGHTLVYEPRFHVFHQHCRDMKSLLRQYRRSWGLGFMCYISKCLKDTGGWLFGYMDAMRLHGIKTCIFCFSDRIEGTVHRVHRSTGAEFVVMRTPSAYRRLRQRTKDPYGLTIEAMFGPTRGLSRQVWRLAHHLVPYLATVMTLAREIRLAGCCAILCQEYESPRFDASVAVGRMLRIPVFATFQGGSWHRSGIERRLRPLTLQHCAGLIIGSSVEAARVRERYRIPSEKISRIFNPLDLSEWRPSPRHDARRKLGIPDATRIAIWHGRWWAPSGNGWS